MDKRAKINSSTTATSCPWAVIIDGSSSMPGLGLLSSASPPQAPEMGAEISTRIEFENNAIMERLCTLNTATFSTRTNLAPKPTRNTLNHV